MPAAMPQRDAIISIILPYEELLVKCLVQLLFGRNSSQRAWYGMRYLDTKPARGR